MWIDCFGPYNISALDTINFNKLQKMKVLAVGFTLMVVASMAAATLNLPSFADLKAKKAEHKANKFNQTTTVAPETRSINETETAIPVTGGGSRIVWVQQMVYVPVLVSDNTTGADAIRSGGLKAQMGGIPTSILSKNLKSVVAAPPGMVSPYLAYSNTNPPVVGIVASARASSDDQLVESKVAQIPEAPSNPTDAIVVDAVADDPAESIPQEFEVVPVPVADN